MNNEKDREIKNIKNDWREVVEWIDTFEEVENKEAWQELVDMSIKEKLLILDLQKEIAKAIKEDKKEMKNEK